MSEQLVIKRTKEGRKESLVIKINQEAANILADFAFTTGYSKYKLASEMIIYASKHIEIIEGED